MGKLSVVSATSNLAIWDSFTPEVSLDLQILVGRFRDTSRRIASDLFVLTETLSAIQNITGDNFFEFASQVLNVGERQVRRYLHINKVFQAHFMTDGRFNPSEVEQFSQRALNLLAPDTDEQIIIELRTMAQNGSKVDEKTVTELLAKHNDQAAQIVALQADLKTVQTLATTSIDQLNIKNASLLQQDHNNREMVRRLEEQLQAIDEEITTLRSQSVQVKYVDKPVDVIPEGYKTATEAIEAAERKKNDVESELSKLEQKRQNLEQQVHLITAGADEFLRMKEEIERCLMKFPVAMIRAASTSDPEIKSHILGMSEIMSQFADQLKSAVA